MKNIKNKKAILVASAALVAAAVLGFTFAVNQDRAVMNNTFGIADYTIAYSEEFVSPQTWKTCDETPKTFTVKNEGDREVTVRIKYEEYWRNKTDTEYLQPIKDGVQLVTIVFQNEDDWILKSDGYYYYKESLAPGATTSSYFKAVKLNCDANLGKDNICTKTTNGTVCEKPADEYEGASYHLKITAETKQVGANNFHDVMAGQANPRDYVIDFTKRAVASSDVFEANGNGVNRYTENGKDIYYYRGEVDNNNVIWANLCWKILRSTAMGGTKLLYSGAPTTVDGVRQCNATGAATQIGQTTYRYANSSYSPADVGYKYGARIQVTWFNPGSTVFIYSNDVSRNGNTYTLDTSEGQSISGTWLDTRDQAAVRYHYFCTNGASTCSNTQIGYIQYYNDNWSQAGYIYYLPLNGYDNINQAMDAMYRNDTDSVAKSTIETWFRNQHLDQYEDDLEDAVYCNDRTLAHGAFIGKDANAIDDKYGDASSYNVHSEYMHTTFINEDGNLKPVLECPNTRDSFTKSEEYGNGQLNYKVGMMTSSETVLAGLSHWKSNAAADTSFIYSGQETWTISPVAYGAGYAGVFTNEGGRVGSKGVYEPHAIRPVVTLKAGMNFISGTGEKTNPYIVE
jgi:alternate signal-mediated exported protein